MAITEAYANTQSVSTTEWSLVNDSSTIATDGTDGVYQIFLDLNALGAGDVFRFRIYEKVQSSDTQRIAYECYFSGPQAVANFTTEAMILLHGWDASLLKISGTDRTITWSIRKVS